MNSFTEMSFNLLREIKIPNITKIVIMSRLKKTENSIILGDNNIFFYNNDKLLFDKINVNNIFNEFPQESWNFRCSQFGCKHREFCNYHNMKISVNNVCYRCSDFINLDDYLCFDCIQLFCTYNVNNILFMNIIKIPFIKSHNEYILLSDQIIV